MEGSGEDLKRKETKKQKQKQNLKQTKMEMDQAEEQEKAKKNLAESCQTRAVLEKTRQMKEKEKAKRLCQI